MLRIIIIVLLAISVYAFSVHFSLKSSGLPTIAAQDRPDVQYGVFMQGLSAGTIRDKKIADIAKELSSYIQGDNQLIYTTLIALFSGGHILIQGHPGTGKTMLTVLLSRLCDVSYARIQCTPDLLPQDVLGTEIFDHKTQEFIVRPGPLAAHIVHVDEINRATPKLQSGFLEAMQEQAITIGNERIALPRPFFLIATQNPYDAVGTYMLPYAQVDRFMIGAYTRPLLFDDECRLLQQKEQQKITSRIAALHPLLQEDTIVSIQQKGEYVDVPDDTMHHALRCIHTVKAYGIPLSTRASKALLTAAKTRAYMQEKTVVDKTDVDAVLPIVLRHRVAHLLGKDIDLDALYRLITGSAQKDDIGV